MKGASRRSRPGGSSGLPAVPTVRLCPVPVEWIARLDRSALLGRSLSKSGAEPGELAEILLGFGPAAVPFLRERLAAAPGVEERRLTAATLGEVRALQALPELLAGGDGDDELTARAARALGRIGDSAATGPLIALLGADRAWFVRVAAASALGMQDDPSAAPALVEALGAEEWDLRNAAARSLADLGEAGLGVVLAHLDDVGDTGLAHFAGLLDVGDRLGPIIARAAAGDEQLDRFVHRVAAAGVRARLEGTAAGEGAASDYAARLLEPERAAGPAEVGEPAR
jgi:hypothetical protein